MANELMKVSYESLSGIEVTLDAETVIKTLTRGNGKITNQEVAMFIRTCQAKRLDPLENGEVYLIKYDDRTPAQLVVGYHAYIRRAERFPEYRGYKAGVVVLRGDNPDPIYKEGAAVYTKIGEVLIGGWCKVFREFPDKRIDETYAEVSFDEYTTGKANWVAKPGTMIRKCAIAQAFRGAFPNEYEGLYTEEEMESTIEGNAVVVEEDEGDRRITQEERQRFMQAIADRFEGKDKRNAVYYQVLENLGVKSTTNMTVSELDMAIKIVENIYEDELNKEAEEVESEDNKE